MLALSRTSGISKFREHYAPINVICVSLQGYSTTQVGFCFYAFSFSKYI